MAQTTRRLTTTSSFGIRLRPSAPLLPMALIITLFVLAPVVFASSDPLRYQGGVRISPSRGLGKKQQEAVLRSLREKTGLMELDFDSDGFLELGDETRISGGSPTARELLTAAVAGDAAFDLETHNRSRIVAFARLGSPISFQSLRTRAQIEVLPVEIDFTDFDRLRGDGPVIAAFDLGMVLLHELAHGVLRLPDVGAAGDLLGECERHINQIRRELRLPERQTYFARVSDRQSTVSGGMRPHAELLFMRTMPTSGRVKRELFALSWEAELVGQIQNEVLLPRGHSGTAVVQ